MKLDIANNNGAGAESRNRANPLAMNYPPYFTIPADSGLVKGTAPCISIKPHLDTIIQLVAERYGPIENYRILAGNLIGTGGWSDLPTTQQHEYVSTKTGAFIASGMMYLEISGSQALEVLDYLTPRDLSKLSVGKAVFTIFTSHSGGVDEEALILRIAEDHFLVSCGGGSAPSFVHEAMMLFPDVDIKDGDYVSFNLKGPGRRVVMTSLIDPDDRDLVEALTPFTSCECRTRAGSTVHVVRTIIGMEMWGLPDAITGAWRDILQQPETVLPCGWDLLDGFRMECKDIGFMLHPLDMNYETTLHEIGLGWMVDRNKQNNYVGKTALMDTSLPRQIKISKLCADPNRKDAPAIGEAIVTTADQTVGYVTSSGYSFKKNRYAAYVHLTEECDGVFAERQLVGWEPFDDYTSAAPNVMPSVNVGNRMTAVE